MELEIDAKHSLIVQLGKELPNPLRKELEDDIVRALNDQY
jgi:hypothetical protein